MPIRHPFHPPHQDHRPTLGPASGRTLSLLVEKGVAEPGDRGILTGGDRMNLTAAPLR
ncbi:hypothetical protein [Billgrantia pellis]|uniref:hypothetical protein n=1 Tax=Billgrantia pellis TaxID=2606936 RepID=UPI00165975CC|nr:hypothetical protein [Halomonas pellis]